MPSTDVHPPRPSSRLAAFAPFRRSAHLATASSSSENVQATSSSSSSGLVAEPTAGGVADVPSPVQGRAPNKPPKPVGLRVRKARALSISLLGGALQNQGSAGQNSAKSSQYLAAPATASDASSYTSLQQALALEDDGGRYPQNGNRDSGRAMPPRSVSALDYYRANGPTKGLTSAAREILPSSNLDRHAQHAQGSANSHGKGFTRPSRDVDDLFVIGRPENASPRPHERRRSISLTPDDESTSEQGSPPQHDAFRGPQGWRLDTARELLAANRSAVPPVFSAKTEAPHSQATTSSKLPLRSQTGATASPFLNTYTAQASLHGKQSGSDREGGNSPGLEQQQTYSYPNSPVTLSSRIPKRKIAPARLGKADILKSTHRTSGDNSAPASPTSSLSSSVRSAPRRSPTHSRTPSASDISPSPSRTRPGPRTRTQSHAFGDATDVGNTFSILSIDRSSHDDTSNAIPQHPLSAQASPAGKWSFGDGLAMSVSHSSEHTSIAPPPVRRNRLKRLSTYDGLSSAFGADASRSRVDDRQRFGGPSGASNPTLQALGQQIGGMGAAVGKRGWDMFKQWSAGANAQPTHTIGGKISPYASPSPTKRNPNNEATRRWLAALNGKAGEFGSPLSSAQTGSRGVFGRSLREAVLLTRLGFGAETSATMAPKTSLDLGSEFKVDLPESNADGSANRTSGASSVSVDRHTARLMYMPGLLVRCIESVEVWGIQEEGIYRLSGRASHTTKLRQIFDSPCARRAGYTKATVFDLCLRDIGPGDLDLNSVSSLLKAYLRDLPDSLIPHRLATELNDRLERECGVNAVGLATLLPGGGGEVAAAMDQAVALKKASATATVQSENKQMNVKIAEVAVSTIKSLPTVNWYVLRELVLHLADLARPDVVAQTRMPLSNLCLVLAPTMSMSVPLLRALIEQRDMLFSHTQPPADAELDGLNERVVNLQAPNQVFSPALTLPRLNGSEAPSSIDNDMKRMSIATITDRTYAKRGSTSSIATVQGFKAGVTPTSDKKEFNKSIDTRRPVTLLEEDDPSLFSSPIAAQFIRRRQASISGSLDSPLLDGSSSSPDRVSIARRRSSIVQPLPRASGIVGGPNDGDSIHSSAASHDDFSSAASSVMAKASNGSLRSTSGFALLSDPMQSSSSISSTSALDRPRPPTRGSTKFMTSGGRPASKSVSRSIMTSSDTMGSSLSHLSSSGLSSVSNPDSPLTPVVQKRERGPLVDAVPVVGGEQTTARFVDEAPMDVKAVRQYWNAQHRRDL